MDECPKLSKCPFFGDQLSSMPAVSGYLKTQFCKAAFSQCARFLVSESVGGEYVPKDMYPNEQQRANEVISKVRYFKK